MSQSLIAFDTDHIKRYVFGTSKLKEIRGASSMLDYLNRVETVREAKKFNAHKIFAHGGSALFLIDSEESEKEAEQLGQIVQERYQNSTGGGASITYAVQPIPANNKEDIMTAEQVNEEVSMAQVLQLLRLRLRLAKDSKQTSPIALPTHALLCMCKSCGMAYAEDILSDPDERDGRFCRVCKGKREENNDVKNPRMISATQSALASHEDEEPKLWERILRILTKQGPTGTSSYHLTGNIKRPQDFHDFSDLANRKGYLGLIYADGNNMGRKIGEQKTLEAVQQFAEHVDQAVFEAMRDAIQECLPVQNDMLPFDILMIGGDDIVMVTSVDKVLDVARTLAEKFHTYSERYALSLSIGIVLAPVTYPFNLQLTLAEDTLKDAKKVGAMSQVDKNGLHEEARISFVVITGSTSLSYQKIRKEMYSEHQKEEFHATLRPYTLRSFTWLLAQLQEGKKMRLGRSKLHQLREAILQLNRTTTILQSLALFRNWKEQERDFIRKMVQELDNLTPQEQKERGTLFPWYLASKKDTTKNNIYRTPLLDFIELYDFVSS